MKAILLRSTDAASCNQRIDYLITALKQISAAVEVRFDASTFSMVNVCFMVLSKFRCMAVKVRFPPFEAEAA
jgi:hypothetical protein